MPLLGFSKWAGPFSAAHSLTPPQGISRSLSNLAFTQNCSLSTQEAQPGRETAYRLLILSAVWLVCSINPSANNILEGMQMTMFKTAMTLLVLALPLTVRA